MIDWKIRTDAEGFVTDVSKRREVFRVRGVGEGRRRVRGNRQDRSHLRQDESGRGGEVGRERDEFEAYTFDCRGRSSGVGKIGEEEDRSVRQLRKRYEPEGM
jgi:hypothetical protein